MAGESKEIKFKFVVDEGSARAVHRVLDDLIKKAQAVGQALQGAGGLLSGGSITAGGKSPSPQSALAKATQGQTQNVSFAKLVGQNVEAFKRVAQEGGAAAKSMSDALGKNISQQQALIERLQQSVQKLGDSYQRVSDIAQKDALSRKMMTVGGQLKDESGRLKTMQDLQSQETPNVPSPASRFGNWFSGGRGLKGAAAGIGAVIGASAILGNEWQSIQSSSNQWKSSQNQIMGEHMNRMRQGDLSQGMAVLRATRRSGELFAGREGNAMHQAAGTVSGITSVTSALTGAPMKLIKGALGMEGGEGPGGTTLGGALPQGVRQDRIRKMMDAVEIDRKAASMRETMALQDFGSDLGSRISAQRVLGMRGFGKGYEGGFHDPYGRLKAQLKGEGYGVDQYIGAYQGLRASAGAVTSNQAHLAMAAQAQGYGGFSDLLGTSIRLGQGSNLALGAIGGGINKTAGIALGQAMLGQGFDVRGTTSGAGALAAAQAGMGFTGGAGDYNLAQRAGAGLEFGGRLTTGALDPLQQGRNLVSAIGIDPSGGTYAQDYLANGMSLKQQLDMAHTGKLTATARALGLDQGMIQQQLGGTMSSAFERFADEGTNNPMANAVRSFRKSGMEAPAYLQMLRKQGRTGEISNLGVAFSQVTGAGEEEGLGLAQILSGADSKYLKKGGMGRSISGVENTALEAQQKIQEDLNEKLKSLGESVGEAAASNALSFQLFGQVNEDMGVSAQEFVNKLDDMVDALENARARLEGRPPPNTGSRSAAVKTTPIPTTAPGEHIGHDL